MQTAMDRLEEVLASVPGKLNKISDAGAGIKPGPQQWSKKEILGHLIDSAGNNLQRFVRAQLEKPLRFPGYEQNEWVAAQNYEYADWALLIEIWTAANRHILGVMQAIELHHVDTPCIIGDTPPVTLSFLVTDYVRHLEHHLAAILK